MLFECHLKMTVAQPCLLGKTMVCTQEKYCVLVWAKPP